MRTRQSSCSATWSVSSSSPTPSAPDTSYPRTLPDRLQAAPVPAPPPSSAARSRGPHRSVVSATWCLPSQRLAAVAAHRFVLASFIGAFEAVHCRIELCGGECPPPALELTHGWPPRLPAAG